MDLESVKILAGAIALIPLAGVGIGLGLMFASYNIAISRNPNSENLLEKKFFLTFALTEALAIFALLISFYLVFG